jgi:glycosyltransferase involved in cell wall biosynthesis
MTADPIGGVWTYALELARTLRPHGIEIILATMGRSLTPEQWQQVQACPNIQVCESDFKLEWMENCWDDVARAGEWLLECEQRFQPELIHLNGYAHAVLPWSAPVLVAGHSCVLSWWRAVRGEQAPACWNAYRDAVERGLHAANLVVAPSRTMLAAIDEHYGPLPHTKVIYNGRKLPLAKRKPKEPFILAAGRLWDKAKNLEILASIAPRLPWPIYLAGEDKLTEANANNPSQPLQETSRQPDNIHFLGQLSPVVLLDWLSRASIYALPARYEPFGLSALEAALAGCARVLGDIPSLREIWGDAALFVPHGDTGVLETILRGLISEPSCLEAWAKRSHARALEFTTERMGRAYLEVYSTLAKNWPPHNVDLVLCES